jgi:hypothetical protein
MHDELQPRIERGDHELPPTTHSRDLASLQQLDAVELARDRGKRIPRDVGDRARRELGIELPTDRLHLGQFGHER